MVDTRQTAIESPFDHNSTAKQVIAGHSLKGKTALVTGGYSGIGLETVRALFEAGARVIAPARTPEKAKAALNAIGEIEQLPLDLSEPDSIAQASETIRGLAPDGLDLMINNAGVMATPERRNSQGWEIQFATNHLGHFALFARVHDLLLKRPGARLVSVSSIAHRLCDVELDDWNFQTGNYHKWVAYGRAKSANALFALEANRRFEDKGLKVFSIHPGGIMTDLQRDLPLEEMQAMGWIDEHGNVPDLFKNTEQGASTTLWAATSALLEDRGGVYCEDCNIAAIVPSNDEGFTGARPHIRNLKTAQRLWQMSQEIVGLTI